MQIVGKLRIKNCLVALITQFKLNQYQVPLVILIYLNETIVRTSYYRIINILKLDIFWPKFQNYQLLILFFFKRRLGLRDSVSEILVQAILQPPHYEREVQR